MQEKHTIFTLIVLLCIINVNLVNSISVNLTESPSKLSEALAVHTNRSKSFLTSVELELFKQSLPHIKDEKCRQDLNATLWGIVAGSYWAISMFDATVKNAVGIESGVTHQFGHYDQCLQPKKYHTDAHLGSELSVPVKYCLIDVTHDGVTVLKDGSRKKQRFNHTLTHWGACVPVRCNASDVTTFLHYSLQRPLTVKDEWCQLPRHELHISDGMFIYALIILLFVMLAVLSTSYHVFLVLAVANGSDDVSKSASFKQPLNRILLTFSLIENTKKLFQGSKDQLGLNSVNGIKALAMFFILAGHVLLFIYSSPVYNVHFMDEQIRVPTFAFLTNSLLFVDVFLLLSGFLLCRILLVELERRRGSINVGVLYVARYIRLTPAYMAIIGFYMTWLPSIGSGPLWQKRIEREQERCQMSWWLNILYINNYLNTDKLCMFQSWYLSVDSQLFFLAPAVIYLLYKSRQYGLGVLAILATVSSGTPLVLTYVRKLDPTLLIYADEITDLASNPFYISAYIKTHMRASAYIIGLLTGYLVHLMQEKKIKLPSLLVGLMWVMATFVGVMSMFSVCYFYVAPFNDLESSLYAGFHKLGWNLAVAWLIVAVTTGHASGLQKVLSSRVFAPISRLSYCAYLSNGIVELYHSSIVRSPTYMNYIGLTNDVFSHILDTFVLAFILCLLFESPILALERILLRKIGSGDSTSRKKPMSIESQTPSTSEEQVA